MQSREHGSMRVGVVLHVEERRCAVWTDEGAVEARYAPSFPSPRVERVSPGHLVALAAAPDGGAVVVWRWYDAVVVGHDGDAVRLWEPAHGEVLARPRSSGGRYRPGSRAFASAGLPGAEWWVAGATHGADPHVDLDEVEALHLEHGLLDAALAQED